MPKFQRNYRMHFEYGIKNYTQRTKVGELEIAYPYTLEFDIVNAPMSSNFQANFKLYNIGRENMANIWLDKTDSTKYVVVSFYAGYGDTMPLVFKADLIECMTYRDSGSCDYITDISANTAREFWSWGFINTTVAKGGNIYDALLAKMPYYKKGYISSKIQPAKRNKTYCGKIYELLCTEYQNMDIYIDKDELNIIAQDEAIPGEIDTITSATGLLGTPKKNGQLLQVDMLFAPEIKCSQVVRLISDTLGAYIDINSVYKVVAIRHHGVISPVVSGECITNLSLFVGSSYEPLKKQTATYGGEASTGSWIKPVQGKISSSFDEPRKSAKTGNEYKHTGIDIAANANTEIKAVANGKILSCLYDAAGYGYYVIIDHGLVNNIPVKTLYAHMHKWSVQAGQVVSQGDTIGYVGTSGHSTGPHCHFEVMENNIKVNPAKYIGVYS